MKYCEEYAALLDPFVDGELSPEETERVRAHLKSCPGCRAYVDDALAIRAGFPAVEKTEVPEDFAASVMERIRESRGGDETVKVLKRRSFRRWTGTVAALAACCALVIFVRTGGGDAPAPAGEAGVYRYSEAGMAEDSQAAEDSEADAVPRMAPAATPQQAPQEEKIRMAAGGGDVESNKNEETALATAPEALLDDSAGEGALYLTREEAGDLLDGYAVVWENAVEWHYELNAGEYRALLDALGRQGELSENPEGSFLVVVTGPVE